MLNLKEIENTVSDVIAKEISGIQKITPEGFAGALCILHNQTQIGGKIIVSGMGKAGQVGYNIATTLSSTGTPAVFLHPSEAQHGDLGIMQRKDVFLLLSNSGRTNELLELVDLALQMDSKTMFVGILGDKNSPLAEKVDKFIFTGGGEEACPLGKTPTTSTTAMMVIGDILVNLLMQENNFTVEEYLKRHHGGYLGVKRQGRPVF